MNWNEIYDTCQRLQQYDYEHVSYTKSLRMVLTRKYYEVELYHAGTFVDPAQMEIDTKINVYTGKEMYNSVLVYACNNWLHKGPWVDYIEEDLKKLPDILTKLIESNDKKHEELVESARRGWKEIVKSPN